MKWVPYVRVLVILAASLCSVTYAQQVLTENCTISVLNRSVRVQPDGTWVIPNIPAGFGKVKARATCTENGITISGESEPFEVPPSGNLTLPPVFTGLTSPVPDRIAVSPSSLNLTRIGEVKQLVATAYFDLAPTRDIASDPLTSFSSSNAQIVSVTQEGLITAAGPGIAFLQVLHEGASAIVRVQVQTSGDSDQDGIPDDVENRLGLNPNDAGDGLDDPDRDGLRNSEEFQRGTDLRRPDTDGDGIKDGEEIIRGTNPLLADTDGDLVPDGLEIQHGTNPLNVQSVNLAGAIERFEVLPVSPVLIVNSLSPEASVQLRVTGILKDTSRLDLSSTARGTRYTSSDLTICNFGARAGEVFAGQPGACTVTVTNGTFSTQVPIRVENFNPTVRSQIPIPHAVAIDIAGNYAYVVGGTNVSVVDISDRTSPRVISTLTIPQSDLLDVRVLGDTVFAAGSGLGLVVVDVSSKTAPQLIRTLDTPGSAQDIALAGTRLYLADGSAGLLIYDIAVPANPQLLSTTNLSASAIGVDVDLQTNIAAIAMGANGLRLVDVSNPVVPALRGSLPGGSVADVALRGTTAFLADASFGRSFTAVNIANPDAPAITTSLLAQFGGLLFEVAIAGDFAFGADMFFINDTPVIDISNPLTPVARFILRFPGDASGTGVKADASFVYLISGNQLSIGQYRALTDNNGVPPTVSIASPTSGTSLIARSTVPITINATDDVAVSAVQLLMNGQVIGTAVAAPYLISLPVPKGITQLSLTARAIDLGGNVGTSAEVGYSVIVGPLTTVTGSGVDRQNSPVANARVNVGDEFYAQSGTDGRFSIPSVPAALQRLRVYGEIAVNGVVLRGRSALLNIVSGGSTNVGQIIYFPDKDWDGLPDDYEVANSCLDENSRDDEGDPDGDGLTTFRERELNTSPCRPNLLPGQTWVSSHVFSVLNGSQSGFPVGFSEVQSKLVSINNGSGDILLPLGTNEAVSTLIAVSNTDLGGLPSGLNESFSSLISVLNGTAASFPMGLNESISSLISIRNGSFNSLLPGTNESLSALLSIQNGSYTLPAGKFEAVSAALIVRNGNTPQSLTAPSQLSLRSMKNQEKAARSTEGSQPIASQTWVPGQTITFRYEAGKFASHVQSVEFLIDGVSLGAIAQQPYELSFVIPAGVTSLQIRAIAKDAAGQGIDSASEILAVSSLPDKTMDLILTANNVPFSKAKASIVIPGLRAEYFDFPLPLVAMPELKDKVADKEAIASSLAYFNPERMFGPDPFGMAMSPDFAVRFTGLLYIKEPGDYRFSLLATAGALIELDGTSVPATGSIRLDRGAHRLQVSYHADVRAPELVVSYARSNEILRPIPTEVLFHIRETATSNEGRLPLTRLPAWIQTVRVTGQTADGLLFEEDYTLPSTPSNVPLSLNLKETSIQ